MLGILVSGGVSGGHLNPAITVAVASIGKFPWRKVSQELFKKAARTYFEGYLKGKSRDKTCVFCFL